MAPGTRPARETDPTFLSGEFGPFEEEMESTNSVGDPWLSVPDVSNESLSQQQGFEDTFVEGAFGAVSVGSSPASNQYEPNDEYLNLLESKLKRIEGKRKKAEKVSPREVLKSLRDTKEKQLDWNFRQGISSPEDDTLDSDSSGAGNSLSSELKRKLFPEQHALNETELLHLLDHDIIAKIFNQIEISRNSSNLKQ